MIVMRCDFIFKNREFSETSFDAQNVSVQKTFE